MQQRSYFETALLAEGQGSARIVSQLAEQAEQAKQVLQAKQTSKAEQDEGGDQTKQQARREEEVERAKGAEQKEQQAEHTEQAEQTEGHLDKNARPHVPKPAAASSTAVSNRNNNNERQQSSTRRPHHCTIPASAREKPRNRRSRERGMPAVFLRPRKEGAHRDAVVEVVPKYGKGKGTAGHLAIVGPGGFQLCTC